MKKKKKVTRDFRFFHRANEFKNFVNESCKADWKKKFGIWIAWNGGELREIAENENQKFISTNSCIYGFCLF